MASQVDQRLASRISDALGKNEKVVFATRRDIVAILPHLVKTIFYSLVGLAIAYSLSDFARGIPSRALLFLVAGCWARFFLVSFLDWNYEILALTSTENGTGRGYARKGYWKRSIASIKLNSLVSTPIRQNKNYSQSIIGTGDLVLDVFGSEEADLRFSDCPRPFEVVRLAAELAGKDK